MHQRFIAILSAIRLSVAVGPEERVAVRCHESLGSGNIGAESQALLRFFRLRKLELQIDWIVGSVGVLSFVLSCAAL